MTNFFGFNGIISGIWLIKSVYFNSLLFEGFFQFLYFFEKNVCCVKEEGERNKKHKAFSENHTH